VTLFAGQDLPRMLRSFFHICRESVAGKVSFNLFLKPARDTQINMTAAQSSLEHRCRKNSGV
jgi:hypothetical protein